MTPQLREMVGTGTLGADKIQASRVTDAQKENNKRVAKGWKIQNLNKTVDTILEAATRLEKEMETETKYWEQVLAVSNNGWAVCRLPNEKHTLGVRFGFSEGLWPIFLGYTEC
jgi:mediator of RNA polymerase II transcription subunit 17, fungi type